MFASILIGIHRWLSNRCQIDNIAIVRGNLLQHSTKSEHKLLNSAQCLFVIDIQILAVNKHIVYSTCGRLTAAWRIDRTEHGDIISNSPMLRLCYSPLSGNGEAVTLAAMLRASWWSRCLACKPKGKAGSCIWSIVTRNCSSASLPWGSMRKQDRRDEGVWKRKPKTDFRFLTVDTLLSNTMIVGLHFDALQNSDFLCEFLLCLICMLAFPGIALLSLHCPYSSPTSSRTSECKMQGVAATMPASRCLLAQ